MNKKKVIVISSALILFSVLVVILFISFNKKIVKSYDIEVLKEQTIRYYDDQGIRLMDFIDTTNQFGISNIDIDNSLFMSNISNEEQLSSDMLMLVVMNTNNPTYYYDIFQSYIDTNKLNITEEDTLELFNKSILVKGDNFVYFIVGKDSKTMEKEINLLYK